VAFLSQDLFITLLSIERKRCERSGQKFALALLDIQDIIAVRDTFRPQLRTTDLTGWYLEPKILGIIFTALNGASIPTIRSTLHAKIRDMVQDEIPFKLFIFPEDVSRELYPEWHVVKRNASYHAVKRAIDIAGSLTALTLLSPVFLVTAALAKLSSPPAPYFSSRSAWDFYSWHKRRVLEAKPGITSLWQVCGRSRTTFDEMVRLDIRYINEQSLLLDLKILLQTPRAVLFASGAY
jgi:hypothetical protein